MENQARYVLVGLFTVAILAAGFTFVYWLNTSGGLQQRDYYLIRYQNSVSGLLVGSAVQFDGVRVGEVTRLDFNPAAPKEIAATIAVATGTPVRADTKAGIEFQGLMGAPAVALMGGTSAAALPAAGPAALPVITADPNAGQSMTEVARTVLRRLDTLISDNSEPLHNTIGNLSKFSDALGRNTDRIDGIVAGIERMTGGAGKSPVPVFDLAAPHTFPKFEKPAVSLLVVPYPTAPATLGQDKILLREGESIRAIAADAKWSDMLLEVFQSRVIQGFENAGFLGQVNRPVEGTTADFQLVTDLRKFEIVTAPQATAEVEYSAKVLNSEGHIVGARVFHAEVPAQGTDAPAAASALNTAFGSTLTDLVVWASSIIRSATAAAR
jgi:phospholipid/cholesterol/gamma-HCH transport system substrate-binding protein